MALTTLVTPAELARHLADPAWVIVDCRHDLAAPASGEAAYQASHIPGARFMHLDRDLAAPSNGRNGRHPLPDAAAFTRRLGELGITPATQVVAYDAQGGLFASRLWWMLRHWLGHDAAAVLDGGWTRWQAEGLPHDAASPRITPAAYAAAPRASATADAPYVLSHLGRDDMLVVDARAADRYRGENETLDPVGGHIPGARNRFFRDNLEAGASFKPAAALRTEYDALLAGRPANQVVHQCGSGVSACHNVLAMEIAGFTGTRLYPGSWSEWCADPSRPVATGAQP